MPLRYDIPQVSDLVFVTGFGAVDAGDGIALTKRLLADARLAPEFGVLVRVAELHPTLEPRDVDEVARAAQQLVERGHRRTAVVASDDSDFDLADALARRARDFGVSVRVFDDDLEAVTWLVDA